MTSAAPFRRPASRLWISAAVVVAAGLAAGLLALPRLGVWWKERALPRGQKPTVLLVTLDATRADRLGAYGYEQGRTPAVDELARAGRPLRAGLRRGPAVPALARRRS